MASVKSREKAVIIRQIAVMLASGMHLGQAVESTARAASPVQRRVLEDLSSRLQAGQALSEAMAHQPQAFPKLGPAMAALGERSGRLSECLGLLADWSEREERLRMQLVSAFTYPLFCLSLCLVLTLVMFRFILPGFFEVLQGFDVELPWLTRATWATTRAVQTLPFWLALAALLSLVRGCYQRLQSTPQGRARMIRWLVKIPQWGGLSTEGACLRYCLAMSMALEAGQDLLSALHSAAQASQDPRFEHDLARIVKRIQAGESLSTVYPAAPQLYPAAMRQLVAGGEESATLDQAFRISANYLQGSLELRLDLCSRLLEPLILAFVASLVGLVVLSVFLPLSSYLGSLAQ